MARRNNDFQTIRSEGGLLPPDLMRRIIDPREKLNGTRPEDYGLPQGERLNEVITQSWNRLRKHWAEFRASVASLPEGEAGTGITNDKWNLPLLRELGFGLLPTSVGPEIEGRSYAINRFFGPVPIHLVGCGLSLDRRVAGVRGASAANPHGLVQEFLNRSDSHLWAIVANGLRLRILRDNQALSRQSFLEIDLEAMFTGEVYSNFVLLWLMAHATRFVPRESNSLDTCWLEQWTKIAAEQGTRALGDLRIGVEKALQNLGEGFTSHPRNTLLREALRAGHIPLTDFHGQLLRVVYRMIFLFVAEDRTIDGASLLHPRDASEAACIARECYYHHYSTARLREMASKIKGSRHGDLWRQFQLIVGALSGDENFASARDYLALPTLGSFLWDPVSTAALNNAELTNHDFLEALRHLAFTRQGKVLRPVDYKNLGAEELGGVYECLLALTPQISADGACFTFAEFAGNERKTSGSYYTPDSLVQCLLDSALDPVVEQAIKGKSGVEAEKAILALKVCDPAVGSGHFLVGAAHRLARHLARVRALAHGESDSSPLLYQHALRDIIGHSLYGVDINPMAAELCRVSLWLEALEPGKPLTFLDHHIRVGNSLMGTTPELIAVGLPDDAFNAIEGDDKKACSVLKKRNKTECKGLGPLFAQQDAESLAQLQQAAAALEELPDNRPEDIRAKESAYRRHEQTEEYCRKKQLADTWSVAFVIRKYFSEPGREASACGITQSHLNDLAAGRPLPEDLSTEVRRLSDQFQFFHWHLAFPEVFSRGGFDCVLGNPPWEKLQIEEQGFFASKDHSIARASAKTRKRLISELELSNPILYREWIVHKRTTLSADSLLKNTGRFPLTGTGKLNTYSLFAELALQLLAPWGRIGCVLPLGLVTDEGSSQLFGHIVTKQQLSTVLGFENESFIFSAVHHSFKFCLLVLTGTGASTKTAELAFFCRSVEDARNPARRYVLGPDDVVRLNPNTLTCPIFRSGSEALLVRHIYRGISVMSSDREEPLFKVRIQRILNSTDDVGLLEVVEADPKRKHQLWSPDGNIYEPVYEAKMFHQFDHRFGTYVGQSEAQANQGKLPELSSEQHFDSHYCAQSRWWVEDKVGDERTRAHFHHGWVVAFRDITSPVVFRTAISAILPHFCTTETCRCVFFEEEPHSGRALAFVASFNSFPLDFVCRTKFSGNHLSTFIVKQLPIPTKETIERLLAHFNLPQNWIEMRVIELTYTAWDLESFAQDCGWTGPPFRWDEERRFLLRCELDAVFFHLFLQSEKNGDWRPEDGETPEDMARLKASFPTPRDAVAYIMDTFPIVRRKDEERYDRDYRTKRVILEIYDALGEFIRTGQPYQPRLSQLGPPVDANGRFISMYQLNRDNWPAHIHQPHTDWDESLLNTWFDICQQRINYLEDEQIFPWEGREAFVYALIPYLVQEKPGEKFEFYRDASLLASRAELVERLLLDDNLCNEYRQLRTGIAWLNFADGQHIRPRRIRESLQGKQIVQTAASSGATEIHSTISLPPLPMELTPLLPLILKAADNLDKMQRGALEAAEAAKITSTRDEIANELKALSAA